MNPQQSAQQPAQPAAYQPQAGPAWVARASSRTPLHAVIGVEFRKLAGTRADRIVLILAPIAFIGLLVLGFLTRHYYGDGWPGQILSASYLPDIAMLVIDAALVKLIAGEWQHRSAQPYLLAQPSRPRLVSAQLILAASVWVVSAAVLILLTYTVGAAGVSMDGHEPVLGSWVGAVIGICALATLGPLAWAVGIALLVPNTAGALGIYLVSTPVLSALAAAPTVTSWFNPLQLATVAALAPTSPHSMPWEAVIPSALITVAVLVAGIVTTCDRDAA
jgi:hypothetical protein